MSSHRLDVEALAPSFGRSYWRSEIKIDRLASSLSADSLDDATFRLLANHVPTLCWIARGDGYIVWYNRCWHDYCGTTPEQMEGWGWQSVHDEALLPFVLEKWTASIKTGEPFEMTFPLKGADGIFRPFLTRVQAIRNVDNQIVRWVGVNTDVSDQVTAETALRLERDRSRNVLENMAEAFILLDRDFRVIDINAEAMRMESRSREEILGKAQWDVWAGTETSELGILYKHAMAQRTRIGIEHFYRWPDGREAWIEMRAFPSGDGLAVFYRDVTERRNAEARIAESEDHYRNAVELNPQTVWTSGPDGQLDRVGQRWMEWTGNSGLGSSWGEAIHPEDLQPSIDAWMHSFTTGAAYDIEHRVRMRDGAYHWMHSRAYPRRNAQGGIAKWYGMTQDVHERKVAQADLAASEAQFRTVAETMPGFVWTADESGNLNYTSPNWHAYSGTDPFQSQGQGWAQFVHPDDQARAFDEWSKAVGSKTPYEVEFRLRRADGAYRWWLARARPGLAAGEGGGWVGVCTDVDDIILARETLSLSRAQLTQAVEERTRERDRIWNLIPDLLMTGSLEGRIFSVNAAWTDALGYDENTLLTEPFWPLIHPDQLADSVEAVRRMKEGHTARHQNQVRTLSGDYRWFDWVSTPVGDNFYAVARDITALKTQEADLKLAQEALRQSQKMEAVGQLTGGIAHDFNNLLAGISGSLELMQTRIAQGKIAELDRYIIAAQRASKRAASLTHRLLAFSRRQTLDPKPTDIVRLIAGMEELIQRTVGPAIQVETVAAAGLWSTLIDPNQLENALLNLCINARDAMPDGGKLVIETANRWLDGRGARERDLASGQYVSLCVSDNGTGMSPDVIEHAFDPFFTTKPIGVGTGLGLSMIYGFARQSGGQVRIYSEVGEGTMVCLYLPRSEATADVAESLSAVSSAPMAETGQTVLVIDDEMLIRMLVVEVLEDLGYSAVEAADGPSGLKILRSGARIDLLVTDVGLPNGMNGRQVADAARELRPGLKVLFITGYAENAVLSHGHLDKGMHVVTKPFAMDDLAIRIKDLLSTP